MPAVDSFLDHTQKGFIVGRSMSDHIHTLNDIFYRSWRSDDPYFVLFTDNRRAFDSIHHSFIYSTLSKQGFPPWFLMAVKNLLSDVVVSPFLCPDLNIPILRGVKQGCPLSPLLFVLTYDTLIHQLKQIPDATPLAAADDLALGSPHIDTITNTFPLIDAFTTASGMGINIEKSGILPSSTMLQKDPDIISAINRSAWPNVKLLSDQKYLGLIFSNNPDPSITINKSFNIALNKFNDRANLFKAAFSKMDLRRRVSAFNIFLASLFSYVIGFYLPPHHIYSAFKSIASWLIIPYSGTGYIYEYLVVPGKNGGCPFSVQDLFVSSMLRQISDTDVAAYINDKSIRPWPLNSKDVHLSPAEQKIYRRDHRFFNSTPLISEHRQLAVMDFISENYLNIDDNSPPNDPAIPPSLTKAHFKEILIKRGFTEHTRFTEHFVNKHHYWSCPEHPPTSPISVIYDRLPPSIRLNYFRLFTNSAATRSRTRFFTNEVPPSHPNPYPCFLCDSLSDNNPDSDDKGTDRLQHIFVPSQCSAVWDALTLFRAEGVISTRLFNSLSSLSWPLFLLRFPSDTCHSDLQFEKDCVFVLTLCYAIWRTRSLLIKGLTGNSGDIIFKQTMRFSYLWDPETIPSLRKTLRHRSIYGSAGRRDDDQSLRALEDTRRLIASAPTSTCLIFTDGASRGNPGPAGASAVFYAPGSSRPFSAAFKFIGRNTNNIAEVTAIKIALIASRHWIRSILSTLPNRSQVDKLNLLILTDSKLIYALVSKRKFGKAPAINESLNTIYDILNNWITPKTPIIRWIPGHSNFPGNNAADDFANYAIDHPDSVELPSLGFSTYNLNSSSFTIRPSQGSYRAFPNN
jgi:ribonuclease HI